MAFHPPLPPTVGIVLGVSLLTVVILLAFTYGLGAPPIVSAVVTVPVVLTGTLLALVMRVYLAVPSFRISTGLGASVVAVLTAYELVLE